MVDRCTCSNNAILLVGRGYESYNNLAHIQGKDWKFPIRIKNGATGIASGLALPKEDEFDVPFQLLLTRKQSNSVKELLKGKTVGSLIYPRTALYVISVRWSKTLPATALYSDIRLPSDSTSRWAPLLSANASCYQARSGLSPPSYCPCRTPTKKSLQKTLSGILQALFTNGTLLCLPAVSQANDRTRLIAAYSRPAFFRDTRKSCTCQP